MKKPLALLALLLCTLAAGAAPDLTPTLTRLQQQSSLPGFAAAVVSRNGVLYQRGFGYADLARKTPYMADTLQNLGSVSKTVVGVALVKAVELGYFTLDTEIDTILPFKVARPAGTAPITIRHLATHTSGIVDDDDVYGHSYFLTEYSDKKSPLYRQFQRDSTVPGRRDLTLATFLRDYLTVDGRYYKASNIGGGAPGSMYAYSNIGAALAAYLVEIKSGQGFDSFTRQYIFAPLGMHSTSWRVDAGAAARLAKVYNRKRQAYPHYGLITYPDGGLISSAADLSLYLMAMLKGYAGQDGILSAAGFRLLFDKQFADDGIPVGSPKSEPNGGVFWRIKPNGQIGHTGSDPGITTFLFFDPVSGKGKVLMTNTEFDGGGDAEEAKVMQQFIGIWKALDRVE